MNDTNDTNIFGETSLCSLPDYTNFCLDLSTSYNDTKDNNSKDSNDLKGRWLYQCSPGGQYLGVTHALQNISQHPENYLCTQPSVKNVPCPEFDSGEGKWQCLPPPFRNININNIQNSEVSSSHLIFPPSLSPSLPPSLSSSPFPTAIVSKTKIKINNVFLVLFSMGLGILLSLAFIAFVQN
jgi:hypothetical protein